jgi:hypothetical protein
MRHQILCEALHFRVAHLPGHFFQAARQRIDALVLAQHLG